ncbi:MAG: AtpZ/AtpI family protein [Candidatus Omnitrophica bacterium]|nr:AtpZ/AtpI family protein [Candidatus Omnitrophota bacterium]
MQNSKNNSAPNRPSISGFGWTMVGGFLFCFFAGFYADQKWGTGYLWTLIGIGAGVILVIYELWKILH